MVLKTPEIAMFENRIQAGEELAEKLLKFKGEDLVILALPRGGLPLGKIVAERLNAPLDVVLTKKIGHPLNKEYAIGAVSLDDVHVFRPGEASQSYIDKEAERIRKILKERDTVYHRNVRSQDLKNKTIIIIDDGIATGSTVLATVALVVAKHPKAVVVAIPVAPPTSIQKLKDSPGVDEVICLEIPYNFQAVGQFYEDFGTVSDDEAIAILEEVNPQK